MMYRCCCCLELIAGPTAPHVPTHATKTESRFPPRKVKTRTVSPDIATLYPVTLSSCRQHDRCATSTSFGYKSTS